MAKKDSEHQHAEAFRLMKYLCEECKQVEWIWNSRDGVTPFMARCRTCDGSIQHVEWEDDPYLPDFTPPPESRMFVDLSPKRAVVLVRSKIETWWNHAVCPMSEMFESKNEAEKQLLAGKDYASYQPDLVTVEANVRANWIGGTMAKHKSGKLVVRMPYTLHASLIDEAVEEGVSLNSLIICKLSLMLGDTILMKEGMGRLRELLEQAKGSAEDVVVAAVGKALAREHEPDGRG